MTRIGRPRPPTPPSRAGRAGRAGRTARDEHGGTLVVVLVLVVVMGVWSTATLDSLSVGMRTQSQMEAAGAADSAAVNALTETLQALRQDMRIGRADPAAPCGTLGADDAVRTTADGYTVECRPLGAENGSTVGLLPDVPAETLLALGGRAQAGKPAHDGTTTQPFCHAGHQGGNTECEASIWIGPGVGANGAVIAQTATANAVAIRANGALVVNQGSEVLRTPGMIHARYACVGGTTPGGDERIQTGWRATGPVYDNAANLRCDTWDPPDSEPVVEEPATWWHALRDRADERSEAAFPDAAGKPLAAVSVPWVTPATCPANGFYAFTPGRYTSAAALDNLFGTCAALYYFPPGVYLFDLDGPLTRAPSNGSQVIGGTPAGWNPPAANGAPTAQDPKYLAPSASNETAWGPTHVYARDVDTRWATTTVPRTSGSRYASVLLTSPTTPIPGAATPVTSVRLEVAHSSPTVATDPDAYYSPPAPTPRYPRLELRTDNPFAGVCYVELPRHAELRTDVVDITNACTATVNGEPARTQSTQNGAWRAGTAWTGATVNALRVRYETARADGKEITSELDGVRIVTAYTGRPAPTFPGACQADAAGVQLVFGNQARILWSGQNSFVELCGSRASDPYGTVLYGLSAGKVPPPAVQVSGVGTDSADPSFADDPVLRTSFASSPTGTAVFFGYRDTGTPMGFEVDDTVDPGTALRTAHDGAILRADWSQAGEAWAELEVPANFVPPDATIVRVGLYARHREDATTASGAVNGTDIARLHVRVTGPSAWATDSNGTAGDVPPAWDDEIGLDPGPEAPGEWEELRWGDYVDPTDDDLLNDRWRHERTLTRNLDTPADINGARIRFTAVGATWVPKRVELDHLRLEVEYRTAGSLRPLRGCLTTRTFENPQTAQAWGVDGWWQPPAPGEPDRRVPDWAPRMNQTYDAWFSDASYAPDATSSGVFDEHSCPLLRVDNGMRLHLSGSIFAPTAAVDLRGTDNRASMVTGGVVARQITLYRWNDPFGMAGGANPRYNPRDLGITVRDPDGRVALRARVFVDDDGGQTVGQTLRVDAVSDDAVAPW